VRGTPASGKSTLLGLLHTYIKKKEPTAVFQIIESWPEENRNDIRSRLQQRIMDFPKPSTTTYILIDNGQDTYWDILLWEIFFKSVTSSTNLLYRVIIFCSYGSAGIRPLDYKTGTPLDLTPQARVSLVPNREQDGEFPPIGLLYTREEFNEVIEVSSCKGKLGEDLQELIFSWTNGYAGAVTAMLDIISTEVSFLDLYKSLCLIFFLQSGAVC
jgi:hypothetical protein